MCYKILSNTKDPNNQATHPTSCRLYFKHPIHHTNKNSTSCNSAPLPCFWPKALDDCQEDHREYCHLSSHRWSLALYEVLPPTYLGNTVDADEKSAGRIGWDLDYHKTLGNARSSRFFVNWCRISSINSNCIYIIERYGNPTIVTFDRSTQIHETSVLCIQDIKSKLAISGLMSSYFIVSPTTKTKDTQTSRNKILPSSHLPKKLVGWFYPLTNIILRYFMIFWYYINYNYYEILSHLPSLLKQTQ